MSGMFRDLPVRQKFMLLMFCTSWVVLLLTTSVFVAFDAKQFRDEEISSQRGLAGIIARNVDDSISSRDPAGATAELSELASDPHIVSLWVVLQSGKVFASYVRSINVPPHGVLTYRLLHGEAWVDAGAVTHETPPFSFGIYADRSLKTVVEARTREGIPFAIVLYSDGEELRKRTKTLIMLVISIIVAASAAGYVLSRRLQRFITAPIDSLVECMERVKRDQDFRVRAHNDSRDEFGLLVAGFNAMLEQVECHEQQILASREELRNSMRRERERGDELELVLELVPAAVLIAHDPAATLITGNRSAEDLLRIDRGSNKAKNASPGESPNHLKMFRNGREMSNDELPVRMAARGEDVAFSEFSIHFDDGSIKHVLGSASTLRDAEGRPRGAVGVFLDISDRKLVEERLALYAQRLVEMDEALRKNLATELHDEVGRDLAALNIKHAVMLGRLPETTRKKLRPLFDEAQGLIGEISRSIVALMHELWPSVLGDYGLPAAFRELAHLLAEKFGVRFEAQIAADFPRLAPDRELALFRIAQEALVNAAKHSGARSVMVALTKENATVRLRVTDDGCGFDPAGLKRPEEGHGWGTTIMRERALSIGGDFSLSSAPGAGTVVTVEVEEKT